MDYQTSTPLYDIDYGMSEPCQKINVRQIADALAPTLLAGVHLWFCGQLAGCPHPDKLQKAEEHDWHLSAQLGHLWPTFHHHYPILGSLRCRPVGLWKYNVPVIHRVLFHWLFGGIFFIILLTIDRYLAMGHAVFALKARTVTFGAVTSGVTWVVAVFASLPGIIFTKSQKKGSSYVQPTFPIQSVSFLEEFPNFKDSHLGAGAATACHDRLLLGNHKTCSSVAARRRSTRLWGSSSWSWLSYFLFWAPYNIVLLLSTFQEIFGLNNCSDSNRLDQAMQVTTETLGMAPLLHQPHHLRLRGEVPKPPRFFRKYMPAASAKAVQSSRESLQSEWAPLTRSTGEQEVSVGLWSDSVLKAVGSSSRGKLLSTRV